MPAVMVLDWVLLSQIFISKRSRASREANRKKRSLYAYYLVVLKTLFRIPSAALQQAISLATTLAQPRDSDKVVQMAGTVKVIVILMARTPLWRIPL